MRTPVSLSSASTTLQVEFSKPRGGVFSSSRSVKVLALYPGLLVEQIGMQTIRIICSSKETGQGQLVIDYYKDHEHVESARVPLRVAYTASDVEGVRWYFEDWPVWPHAPGDVIAERTETRMREIGASIFENVFTGNEVGRRIWASVSQELPMTRLEVVCSDAAAESVPWELIRPTPAAEPLALTIHSLVRERRPEERCDSTYRVPERTARVLLVITRPSGARDVPYRAIANAIRERLGSLRTNQLRCDVLRPSTPDGLVNALATARARGEPYHVVHYDGHGVHRDLGSEHAITLGGRGYLVFEGSPDATRICLMDGTQLGQLLSDHGVGAFVVNACRSGYVDGTLGAKPEDEGVVIEWTSSSAMVALMQGVKQSERPIGAKGDLSPRESWGTFAGEVMRAGIPAVVAMRFDVSVWTAAMFMGRFYAELARGVGVGGAVTAGRCALRPDSSSEDVAHTAREEWFIPVVYERGEVAVVNRQDGLVQSTDVTTDKMRISTKVHGEVEYCGQDSTILMLDRIFATHHIALLVGDVGAGKTRTALEFARWRQETGFAGNILLSRFGSTHVCSEVLGGPAGNSAVSLAAIMRATNDVLGGRVGQEAVAHLTTNQLLWIWDDFHSIDGKAHSSGSKGGDERLTMLESLLQELGQKDSLVLLTSAREPSERLMKLAKCVQLAPLSIDEQELLAARLVQLEGQAPAIVAKCRDLLDCSGGNAEAVMVLTRLAMRTGIGVSVDAGAAAQKVRAGEHRGLSGECEPILKQRHLAASGFLQSRCSDHDRWVASVLGIFRGVVRTSVLQGVIAEASTHSIENVTVSAEDIKGTLGRLAEAGLVYRRDSGRYLISPIGCPFCQSLLDELRPDDRITIERAYARVIGRLANAYVARYGDGDDRVLSVLRDEQHNLRHARVLGRNNEEWNAVATCVIGLHQLYRHDAGVTRPEWDQILDASVEDFLDPVTRGPIDGREDGWFIVNSMYIRALDQGDREG